MKEQGKMNLKRITCAIIAASTLVAVGSLSGCGKKSTGNNVNGEINVSIANWPLEDPELTKMNKKKEKFETDNPNIKITPDTWTFDLQTFYPKAAAGLLPNQFTAFYSEIANLINTGYLSDITDATKEMGIFEKSAIL